MKPFDAPNKSLGDLKADIASRIIAASADVALIVDQKGVIRDMMFASEDLASIGGEEWLGRSWIDTVTGDSKTKVEQLLSSAPREASRWRHVNHQTLAGASLPIRYATVPLGGSNRILAIGQDLRQQAMQQQRLVEAQASMEREYSRLRQAELRYRALFQVSAEAVLIVEAASHRIVEANPAATSLLANGSKRIVGRTFAELFHPESTDIALELLSSALSMPRVDGVEVMSAHGERLLSLSASVFRQDGVAHFLVRFNARPSAGESAEVHRRAVDLDIVSAMPDAFVVVDRDRRVLSANAAFLDLCEMAQIAQVRNEAVDRWLGRIGVDVDVLLAHLREYGCVRRFLTVVRGEFGGREEVEISGVHVPGRANAYYGLTLRKIERPAETTTVTSQSQLPRSVEQLTELVGRVPLKELVRETTDIVERLCIEAALQLTQDNRASAAEMLGLSRQSFYVKMRRHGLGELGGDTAE